MAALNLPILYPLRPIASNGTAWINATETENINNGVATPDGLFMTSGVNSTGTLLYAFDPTPANFFSITSLNYNIRYKIDSLNGDSETLKLYIYKTDRVTLFAEIITVTAVSTIQPLTNKTAAFVLTAAGLAATKADWDAALLAINTTHASNMGTDNSYWSIDEIELNGTYEAPPSPVILDSPADAANVTLTPRLLFTGTDLNDNDLEYNIQIDSSAGFNSGALIDKSSTVDVGFLDSPDQGDTHPFTSGTQVAYTVQSDLNTDVVYYWKVRAIDPTGSNTWGEWSTVRSFRTEPASGWISKNLKIGAWTTKPLKVYVGGQWVVKPLKYFK